MRRTLVRSGEGQSPRGAGRSVAARAAREGGGGSALSRLVSLMTGQGRPAGAGRPGASTSSSHPRRATCLWRTNPRWTNPCCSGCSPEATSRFRRRSCRACSQIHWKIDSGCSVPPASHCRPHRSSLRWGSSTASRAPGRWRTSQRPGWSWRTSWCRGCSPSGHVLRATTPALPLRRTVPVFS